MREERVVKNGRRDRVDREVQDGSIRPDIIMHLEIFKLHRDAACNHLNKCDAQEETAQIGMRQLTDASGS